MGTSASSTGPGSGVPFDPPWLDDIAPPQPGEDPQPDDQGGADGDSGEGQPTPPPEPPPPQPPETAPPRRFFGARTAIGEFARTGKQDAFKRAVGHYSRKGMGGARNAASRMRKSTQAGANAFNILQSVRERTDPSINEWVDSLTARNASAQEIADEIVRQTTSAGGIQDEAAGQESMAKALDDLLTKEPDVDLLNLTDDYIWGLIESFLGYEAFHRLCLDIGQVFGDSALSPRDQVTRMNEMQDYLKAELVTQAEELRAKSPKASSRELQSLLQTALQNTFAVYEGAI